MTRRKNTIIFAIIIALLIVCYFGADYTKTLSAQENVTLLIFLLFSFFLYALLKPKDTKKEDIVEKNN